MFAQHLWTLVLKFLVLKFSYKQMHLAWLAANLNEDIMKCSLRITLCNKKSCADLQISITIRMQAFRDVFIQILSEFMVVF